MITGVRIGVIASSWNQRRGYGRHLRGLFPAVVELCAERGLGHQFVLFVDRPADSVHPFPDGARTVTVPVSRATLDSALPGSARGLLDTFRFSRVVSQADLDAIVFPNVYSFVPVWGRAVKIQFVHDAIAHFWARTVFPDVGSRLRWQAKSWLARSRADKLVTVSEYSRRKLCEAHGFRPEEIALVGEAPDSIFQPLGNGRRPAGLPFDSRLLVYVGGFNPHKNLERLLAAFERVAERVDDVHLVLVGEVEEGPARDVYRHLRESITRRALADRVTFAGFLSDAELAALYSCAYAAVLPSLMEGLGLPAIEAAACGLPVIATRESPLRSLLGDGCLEIDPASVDSIAAAMTRLLGDSELRALAAEAALRGTRSLTWRRAAEQFLDLLVAG